MANVVSVQPFEITIGTGATSNTYSLPTGVNTSNSVIFFGGFTTDNTGTAFREFMPRVEITNGTTVTAYRNTSSASFGVTVRGTVVEFDSSLIGSVQRGTVGIASSSISGTATISSVDTSRTVVFYLGHTNSSTTSSGQTVMCRIDLTDATTITANRGSSSSAALTVGYCAVEFAPGIVNALQVRALALSGSSTTATDTISSVNMANTMLVYQGATCTSSTLNAYLYNLELTGSTQVSLVRGASTSISRTVAYTVLEFVSGVLASVQRGTQAVASVTSADATISTVDTSRAVANWTGFSTGASTLDERFASVKLLDATTVRAQKNTAGSSTSTPGYEAVEFAAGGGGGFQAAWAANSNAILMPGRAA